ncbi:hypothetical protein EVAR_74862_1 [Eumeta japonica]|uniref:Uncharacterized protein n=1 Tax=Eumeta variegata TaxID=151549 RepID=A0A4C1SSB8_EUMVA|nr:hypothetical protein EVAR_74862_1 [Eumeta japonica]
MTFALLAPLCFWPLRRSLYNLRTKKAGALMIQGVFNPCESDTPRVHPGARSAHNGFFPSCPFARGEIQNTNVVTTSKSRRGKSSHASVYVIVQELMTHVS